MERHGGDASREGAEAWRKRNRASPKRWRQRGRMERAAAMEEEDPLLRLHRRRVRGGMMGGEDSERDACRGRRRGVDGEATRESPRSIVQQGGWSRGWDPHGPCSIMVITLALQ